MKLKTEYRYVAWDRNGGSYSFESPPIRNTVGSLWTTNVGQFNAEFEHFDLLSGAFALERYYDTESEEDMKILRALMEL